MGQEVFCYTIFFERNAVYFWCLENRKNCHENDDFYEKQVDCDVDSMRKFRTNLICLNNLIKKRVYSARTTLFTRTSATNRIFDAQFPGDVTIWTIPTEE